MSLYAEYVEKLVLSEERKQEILLAVREVKKSAEKPIERKISNILRWASVAVIILVLCCSIIPAVILTHSQEEGGGNIPTTPDQYNIVGLNEHLIAVQSDGTYDIVVDEIFLTKEISGNAVSQGGYLVFGGEIDVPKFAFISKEVFLDINLIKIGDNQDEHIEFNAELSKELSEVDLIVDETQGAMDGRYYLVFEIDLNNFNLIASGTDQTSFENNVGEQIRLHMNVWWGSNKANVFDFSCDEVKVK